MVNNYSTADVLIILIPKSNLNDATYLFVLRPSLCYTGTHRLFGGWILEFSKWLSMAKTTRNTFIPVKTLPKLYNMQKSHSSMVFRQIQHLALPVMLFFFLYCTCCGSPRMGDIKSAIFHIALTHLENKALCSWQMRKCFQTTEAA